VREIDLPSSIFLFLHNGTRRIRALSPRKEKARKPHGSRALASFPEKTG
jgi:hypothetical protein